jgi:hypothetical protein
LIKLKKIENTILDEVQKNAKLEASATYEKNQSLKISSDSPFSKINKKDFARTAELLSLQT